MQNKEIIGVIGSGSMGAGIAQIAATFGHAVLLYDNNSASLEKAKSSLHKTLTSLQEKGKINSAEEIFKKITFANDLKLFSECNLIIEAIIENLAVKQEVFSSLEKIVQDDCILATNTSSLSVTLIASSVEKSDRVLGIHFFNPAPLMPLVEIIPAVQTGNNFLEKSRKIIDSWNKNTVLAKDTPGFIVNRIARPFYGEAIRIYEEGIADFATIDYAMKEIGKFKMGPFELMDFIGNDINYTVTETVFKEFFYDPRYKPSFTQKRQVESKRLGRKTGRGYYDYAEGAVKPEPIQDLTHATYIFKRILVMLINEACDALYLKIASREDIDLAMTKGVNYPKGLLKWADEMGIVEVLKQLDNLCSTYQEDRYRPSPLLKIMAMRKMTFY